MTSVKKGNSKIFGHTIRMGDGDMGDGDMGMGDLRGYDVGLAGLAIFII